MLHMLKENNNKTEAEERTKRDLEAVNSRAIIEPKQNFHLPPPVENPNVTQSQGTTLILPFHKQNYHFFKKN